MFCVVTKYIRGHISWTGRWAENGSHAFLSSLRYWTHRQYLIKTLTSEFPVKIKATGLAPRHRAAAGAPIYLICTRLALAGRRSLPIRAVPVPVASGPLSSWDVRLLLGHGHPAEEGRRPPTFIFSNGFFLPDSSLILRKASPPPLSLPFGAFIFFPQLPSFLPFLASR